MPRSALAGATTRARAGVEQIYANLREQIVTVALRPGDALSEARIAESFGVSRTPVREAFKRLAEEGLLSVVPQVGSFVAPIDLHRVRDNHFVRETLECRIVGMAARRIDDAQRAELAGNLQAQADAMKANDPAQFFRHDEEMHRLLARIAGHERAWEVIHEAKGQLDRVRRLSLADATRSRARMSEHRAIARCVARRDAAGAERAMREHLASIFTAIDNIATENAHYFVDDQRPLDAGAAAGGAAG
ncbi:MAG: GntR family transcriptional regulator [Burkholderiaceae bacterium]|nr:GntR family transcriptional regulator [Burkholderiaceae bacterium]